MNFLNQSFSKAVLVCIIAWFSFQYLQKTEKVISGESTCVCAYDGFGYYMYLPALIGNGSLDMKKEWAEELQKNYCFEEPVIYQLVQVRENKNIDIYHMGLALVQLPSYLIADQFAKLLDFKRDGFSKPYHIAFILNALFFIILGFISIRKLLRLFFNDAITGIVLLILILCSNLYPLFIQAFSLTHLYLFTLNALFLYYLFQFRNSDSKKHLVYSALLFGLTCFVRPTQAIWGIIPLLLLYNKYGLNKYMLKQLALFPLAAILFNIPHLIYWKIIGGKWLMMNLHTEELVIIDPNLWKFLFSYRKGWLLYSPLFFLLIPGFIYLFKKYRTLFWAFLLLTLINIFVLSSWECWWYSASFGSRVMVDSYPLLAVILGFGILAMAKSKLMMIVLTSFIVFCAGLNILQTSQFFNSYIHPEFMSKEHYWYIFGKYSIANYEDYRLEINHRDTNWVNNPHYSNDPAFHIDTKKVFTLPTTIAIESNGPTTIGSIFLHEQLTTEETLFEVRIKCRSSDSTKSCQFKFEQTGKFNTYAWASLELSLGLPQNEWNEVVLKVNEDYLRHAKDFIQLYSVNDSDAKVEIKSLNIIAHSLIRK